MESVKIVVAGGFGVGKTTFVSTISEITPLTTEAHMTEAAQTIDDTALVGSKTTTTVAMDFGRISLGEDLVLFLFGTPGQDRFWFMWDDLVSGAIGAIIIADVRRLDDCFAAIDYFESSDIAFVVAVNTFEDVSRVGDDALRGAMSISQGVPILRFDARDRGQVRDVLVSAVSHTLAGLARV